MKKITYLFLLSLLPVISYSQATADFFELGIVQNSGYTFDIVAVPDFTSTGNVDFSGVGVAFIMPTGSMTVTNPAGATGQGVFALGSINSSGADLLTLLGIHDASEDFYRVSRNPGQYLNTTTAGVPFNLFSIDVGGAPTSGILSIADNTHPILVGLNNNNFDNFNFISANTGSPNSTEDHYSGLVSGSSSFDMGLLTNPDLELTGISMYPNPASNEFFIKGLSVESEILVHDMNGKLILTRAGYVGDAIDIANIQSGVYFVNITNDGGSTTEKLIIE
jgi:hypothetical protein